MPTFEAEEYSGGNNAKKRRKMYNTLIAAANRYHKRDAAIARSFHKRGLPNGPRHIQHMHKVFGSLVRKLPAPARYHQFAMVCNAVVTAQRTRFFTSTSDSITPCRACGRDKDHIDHYYDGTCEVAVEARRKFGEAINYDLTPTCLETSYKHTSYLMLKARGSERPMGTVCLQAQDATGGLRFNKNPHFHAVIHALIIFNWSFWLALIKHFPEGGGSMEAVNSKFLAIAISAWGRTRASEWREPVGQPGNSHRRHNTRVGSTSNRTKEQKKRAREMAEKQIQEVPADAAIIFTDGSGPAATEDCAGAGVVVLMPRHRDGSCGGCLRASQGFDEGTNNIGEMWAVGMGLQLVTQDARRTGTPLGDIYIFSDSALTVDIIAHRAVPRSNVELCHAVRREANSINRYHSIRINWIAGHVGVEGNELADHEADKGKRRAQKGQGLSRDQYLNAINISQFLPIGQEPYTYNWKPP